MNAIYLDNAATSFPKPEAVYAAVDDYQRACGAAFARGTHGTEHADSLVAQCRHGLAQLLGSAASRSIAFTFNGTDGLNLLLRGILRAGQHVVTTTLEHNSVLRPLEQLRDLPLTVDRISFDPATGLIDLQALRSSLESRPPQLLVVNHVSNVTGIVQPVKEIARMAHDAGSRLLVDAAQSVGHLPMNVVELGIDLLAAPGHKGLLGPLGTGFVYVAPDLEEHIVSHRCGGTGTSSESLQQPKEMPQVLESGNLNMPGIAGLLAALKWWQTSEGGKLQDARTARVKRLVEGLTDISNVQVYCAGNVANNAGVVSFNISDVDCREAALILHQSFGIQCRAGLHCAPLVHQTLGTATRGGTIRFSPGVFTTDDDVDTAIAAVLAIRQSAGGPGAS